ncbi:MAG: 16S rRNA (uracil(1498)-N(3))-methyltransferase [Rhodospirillales bacterium]|nr:16S rRNA (uracil(1498)-N(3))-methyltransferase [Rhodospirillales bacterium]
MTFSPDHEDESSHTLPRLFVDDALAPGENLALAQEHAHYLFNVLRRGAGDRVHLFNGRDGEWIAILEPQGKRGAVARVETMSRPQPPRGAAVHLIFAPLRKDRMDFLIEKAVELGVGAFHPVLTERTENRHPNAARLRRQIIEAAEQCERLDVPILHEAATFPDFLGTRGAGFPLLACIERGDYPALSTEHKEGDIGVLIGPEGGWTERERDLILCRPNVRPVSLGPRILRAETAALYVLARLNGSVTESGSGAFAHSG